MMENQLKIYGISHKLNVVSWGKLRNVANDALNQGIYSPSLVDAALDAKQNIRDIGCAFEKALAELNMCLTKRNYSQKRGFVSGELKSCTLNINFKHLRS